MSAPAPSIPLLRALAAEQRLLLTDADLEATRDVLAVLLPSLERLQELLPQDTPGGLAPSPQED